MRYEQRSRQLTIYIIGTLAFLALPFLMAPPHVRFSEMLWDPFAQKEFLDCVFLILFFYLNYFFLIPKFYLGRKYFEYVALCLISLFIIIVVPPSLVHLPRPASSPPNQDFWHFFLDQLRHGFFSYFAVLLFSLILKINNRWKQAEKDRILTQLSYLKGQIKPHFLFNTLNSIYYLAIEKSEKTPDAIIRLSNMMRFVISDATDDFVELSKEISYVTDYIELQQLRLGHTALLHYKILGSPEDKRIAPLILIPFIENAFKHGINPEEQSSVLVEIEIVGERLTLTVENIKVTKQGMHVSSGLGLENARRRLEIIYPGKHELFIDDKPKEFVMTLKLDLT